MNRLAARLLLPFIALIVVLAFPAPATAQSSITVRVRSLESTAPFGSDSLVVVLIRQNFGSRLTAGSREVVGAVAPGPGNEYTITVPLNANFVPNQSYRIEAYIGDNRDRFSRYVGTLDPVTLGPNNTNVQVTTASGRVPIPEVSAGLIALVAGLVLLMIAGSLLLWRQLRLRPLARRLA